MPLQPTKQGRFGEKASLRKSRAHLGENRPEDGPLRLGKSCLSAEARDVTVVFPSLELPSVDYLVPFGDKEGQSEPVLFDIACGLVDQLAYLFRRRQRGSAEVRFVEAPARLPPIEYTSMRSAVLG